MELSGMYAVVHVSDMTRSEIFFSKLIGSPPDDRPMDGLIQWRDVAGCGLQLARDDAQAGTSALTLVTPDMALARRDLDSAGLELQPDIEGDYGVIAQLSDPDGNTVTLTEPPKRPFDR